MQYRLHPHYRCQLNKVYDDQSERFANGSRTAEMSLKSAWINKPNAYRHNLETTTSGANLSRYNASSRPECHLTPIPKRVS